MEETNFFNLSIKLNQNHVISKNPQLQPMVDRDLVFNHNSSRKGNSIVLIPNTSGNSLSGSVVLNNLDGTKFNTNNKIVKSLTLVLVGTERVRLKVDVNEQQQQSQYNNRGHQQLLEPQELVVINEKTLVLRQQTLQQNVALKAGPNAFPFQFGLKDPNPPPSMKTTASCVNYTLSAVVAFDEAHVSALQARRNDNPVVKFLIVKSGGVRVRNSSRLNSGEVGFIAENTVVCIDQKEWFYDKKPDPQRKHSNGFWRVHVVDCSTEPIIKGWVTGRSNVIDPLPPSTSLKTEVSVVVVSSLSEHENDSIYKNCTATSTGTIAREGGCGSCGCFAKLFGGGGVQLNLRLSRKIYWKGEIGLERRRNSKDKSKKDQQQNLNTITIKGNIKVQNMSKNEIPAVTCKVIRNEILVVKSGSNTHKKVGVVKVQSQKWGPILPNSVFTRALDTEVRMSGNPPTVKTKSGHTQFSYSVQLAVNDVAMCEIPIVILEGSAPSNMKQRNSSVGGGGAQAQAQAQHGKKYLALGD